MGTYNIQLATEVKGKFRRKRRRKDELRQEAYLLDGLRVWAFLSALHPPELRWAGHAAAGMPLLRQANTSAGWTFLIFTQQQVVHDCTRDETDGHVSQHRASQFLEAELEAADPHTLLIPGAYTIHLRRIFRRLTAKRPAQNAVSRPKSKASGIRPAWRITTDEQSIS